MDIKSLDEKSFGLLESAKCLRLVCDGDMEIACLFLRDMKRYQKEIDEAFDEGIKAAYESHKTILASKKRLIDPIMESEKIVKSKMSLYMDERTLKRGLELLEKKKKDRERSEESALEYAQALEASGEKDEAAMVLEEAAEDSRKPMVADEALRKPKGMSTREKWTGNCVDLPALVKAAAGGAAPLSMVQPDAAAIRKFAEATKGCVPIPGVKFVKEIVVAVSAESGKGGAKK